MKVTLLGQGYNSEDSNSVGHMLIELLGQELIHKFARFFRVSDKELTIIFLSDAVAYQVLNDVEVAQQVLKVAEKKVRYMRNQKKVDR